MAAVTATDTERAAVLEILHDRYPVLVSEVGWQLAGPGDADRWAPKWGRKARRILTALEADGLAMRDQSTSGRRARLYWYPDPLPEDAGINLDTGPYPFTPDWCLAPASTLQEWMTKNGLSATVLATACAGRTGHDSALEGITQVLDRYPLTDQHAAMLERGTGVPATFWLALEHNYRAGLAAGLKDCTP